MTVQIFGELVQASAQDFPVESARQKWFRLVRYGEESVVMASGHKFTVPGPGHVVLPQDPTAVLSNEEHDRAKPNGNLDKLLDRQDGLYGRYVAASGPAGDKTLDDIATGRRLGVSVELEAPVIRAGKLLRGFLSHVANVAKPSFPSSTVLAAAADVGEVTKDLEEIAASLNVAIGKLSDEDPQDPQDPPANEEQEPTVPKPVTASTLPGTPAPALDAAAIAQALTVQASAQADTVDHLTVLASAQAQLSGIGSSAVKAAALDNIVQADVFDKVTAPQYVGELWKGRRYVGRYLDLVSAAPMVSQSVIGWRWVAGKTPQVARWTPVSAGTMNDIPTNEVAAEQKTYSGFRIAGGHKVDRIHVDLPSAEWWGSYNLESTDDYARKLDAEVIAHVTDPLNATNLELSVSATYRDRIMEGLGMAIEFADPDWMLLGWNVFRYLADEKLLDQQAVHAEGISRNGPALQASFLGIPVKAAPRSLTDQAERILIGCTPANVLHSLPGGPIRVDAEEIQKGAIQHGVFGYHILRPTDTRGVVDVTVAAV